MAHQLESYDQPWGLSDPSALSPPNIDGWFRPGSFEGDVTAVESYLTTSATSPPEFRPVVKDRLFTAHDAIVGANCEVHPVARLSYDALPPLYRDVFKNCRMYLEKHLEFVEYLHHLSLGNLEGRNEPSSEKGFIGRLGIRIPTEEGDNKKWQCGVVGCKYTGTLQHLVSHLRGKTHIGIPTFACTLGWLVPLSKGPPSY
jgi:hypothetical protein